MLRLALMRKSVDILKRLGKSSHPIRACQVRSGKRMNLYPIMANIEGRLIVVIGGGEVAARKVIDL
jgi:hypothetical protein